MIRLALFLLIGMPLITHGQDINIALEAGGFSFRQYGNGQLQRYKLNVLESVDPTGFSFGLSARVKTRTPFFVQAGPRYSSQSISVGFTDTQPNLPVPNEVILGVGLGLRQLELPILVGFRIGNDRDLHIDVFGGLNPSLNYYNPKDNSTGSNEWYRQVVYKSLKRSSLSYSLGATARYDRWGITLTWDKTMTSLNQSLVYQGQTTTFNMGYSGLRALLSYQFIKK